jgi:DNA repair exonuclease SbcCD ATPase subunit
MNPVYAGLIRVGDELIEATHEAIIDRETWEEAVALQKAKASTHKRGRPSAGGHLFRKGFLRCGICGAAMGPLTYHHRATPKSEVYRCCGRARYPHTCEMSTVARGDIDNAVYAYFRQLDLDVEATREQLTSAMAQRLAKAQDVLDRAEQEAQAAQERLERIKRDYLSGQLNAAEWRELKAGLEPEASKAQAEAERLRAQLKEAESESALSEITTDLLAHLAEIRAEITTEVNGAKGAAAVRAALMRLFDGFVLHRGSPRHEGRELKKVAYWLQPLLSQREMGGYEDRLRQKLGLVGDCTPLGNAKNKFAPAQDVPPLPDRP